MRYRSFGDRSASVSAITVRLDDSRHKGAAIEWRDLVFAALESGVNAFEIGQTSAAMLAGVSDAFAAMERRILVVSWRTTLAGGAAEIAQRARDLAGSLGLGRLDLLTLEVEATIVDPGLLADLRRLDAARYLALAGPSDVIDEAIQDGQFDAVIMKSDPAAGWTERNRVRAAAGRGMGVIALDVGLNIHAHEAPVVKRSRFRLFARKTPAPPPAGFQVRVAGWTAQQVAIAHALTDPAVSTVMVQPSCASTLEGLAMAVERDLPAGAQAQIEMARFSGRDPAEARDHRRRA